MMDDTTPDTQVPAPTDAVSSKTKVTAKFIGADGSEGYTNGQVYTLDTWEENNMLFIAREDGTGQVAYDTKESMQQNWEMQNAAEVPAV